MEQHSIIHLRSLLVGLYQQSVTAVMYTKRLMAQTHRSYEHSNMPVFSNNDGNQSFK